MLRCFDTQPLQYQTNTVLPSGTRSGTGLVFLTALYSRKARSNMTIKTLVVTILNKINDLAIL